jgi:NTE family protein
MGKNALVLGGGGVLGVAWETGLLAGLLENGIDVSGADLIVGTSAGSIVGTNIALGDPIQELLTEQLAADDGRIAELMREFDLAGSATVWQKWAEITEVTQQVAAEIGAMALAAKTVNEDRWKGYFGDRFGESAWPERPLILTAVDCATGEFQTWNRNSGAPLHLAVASSCAVPGLFPPVTINGHRYTDGGVRSGTSADLARGYDAVLIVAPIGARSDGIDPLLGREAKAEAEALHTAGSLVELAFPDAGSMEAMGMNRMDPSRRCVSAEAGIAQGKALAAKLEVWMQTAALATPA